MIFIGRISKGHSPVKMMVELRFFFSGHCLMVVNICTRYHENIRNGIKII